MKYSILVADDEPLIREGFIARLRHLCLEPSNAYQASNGTDALECIAGALPDIVVTDIRMPGMEGLELIRRAKELSPETEFVILSGYAEFTLAEQAIKLGVYSYLVKPLSNAELERVMRGLLQKVEKNRRIAAVLRQAEEEDHAGREWMLEKQVSDLLAEDGGGDPPEPLASFLRRGGWYAAALAQIAADPEAGRYDAGAALEAVRQCFREQIGERRAILSGTPTDRSQCYLLFRGASPEGVAYSAGELLRRMTRQLRKDGIILTSGISAPARSLSAGEARQAQKALCQRIISGGGKVYLYAGLPCPDGESFPEAELSALRRHLERRDFAGVENRLQALFRRARGQNLPAAYLRLLWMRVISLLLNTVGMPQGAEPDRLELDYSDMKSFSSVDDMQKALLRLIMEVAGTGGMDDLDSLAKIRMAVQYIAEHYDRELTVNGMAEMCGLSPNYFSALFHREVGVTVVNYVKNTRIERACALLRDTDSSAAEIAGRSGYTDVPYFFRVFKKETGLSPLQYRKRIRELQR